MPLVQRPIRRSSADVAGQLILRPVPGSVATAHAGTLDGRPQAITAPTSADVVALHKQWDSLTPARRKEILSAIPSNVVPNYAQAIEDLVVVKTKEGKTMRVAERMRPLVEFMGVVGSFASALDAAFPGAGLALTSIKGIFLASKARLDLQDYLVELVVDKISANLPVIRIFRDDFQHSPELMSAALDIYGDVLDIGNRATKFFYDEKGHKRHSLWLLAASNWSSCKDDLEVIRKRFDSHLGNFGRAALFAHAQDTRVGLQLLLENGEQHRHDAQAGLQLVLEEGEKHHRDTRASLEVIAAGARQQEVHLNQLESGLSEQTRMLMEDKSERGRELDSLQAKNRRELLRWIATQTSKHECAAIHDKLQRAAVPGTGEWLLDHPLFRDWSDQRGPGGLWISGKWGTGKSVLASNIIRRLMDRCQTDDSMACAYIYCSSEYPFLASDANKNADVANAISYKRVLGSLLHQLYGALPLDQDLDSLVTLWGQGASLLEVHVEQALRDVMAMFQQAFVVIDGLDEFQRTDDGELSVLCEFIGTLVGSGPSILILSRPECLDISNAMAGSAVIQIDGKANEDDIITFVHEQTSRLGRMGRYEDQIRTELVVRADGVFRWISAVVSYIRHIKTPRARAKAVKTMPPHLKDVYAKILERILNQTEIAYNYAVMALLWTTHATLSVKEMAEALSIETGMTSIDDDDRIELGLVDKLCENCQGLLELSSSGRYQLPHDSVRDFLVGPPDPRHQGLEAFWTLRAQADERIAEACLTYLSLDVFSDVKVTSRKQAQELHLQYPLLRFASHHWGDHVAKLGDSVPPPLQRLVRAFLESDNRRELSLQLLRDDDLAGFFTSLKSQDRFVFRCPRTSVPLHLVAWFGLEHFLPEYISDEAFRSRDGFNLLPIDLATLQQKQKVFDSMLSHFDRELDGGTSEVGNSGPRQKNADTGGKDSPQDDATTRELFSPLLLLPYAIASRETWVSSLRKVLDLGFDPNTVEPTGFAALHAAASSGNVGGVEVLLEMGADPSAPGPDGQTPFLIAAFNRERAVVRVLLDHGGFDISTGGRLGFNALHYFAEYDHELAGEFLRRGGKFESSETGRTPLHFAASASNTDSVRVLCRWLRGISEERLRVELAKQRSDGITALQVAAVTGSLDVVKVLVEQFGDDLMTLTPQKETMLHLGAMADEPKMIDFIIERCGIGGLDPNAQRSDRATALHIAVARGHANFVTALLKAFPNLNTGLQDKFGRVPLYAAALSGDIKIVEMLKDHGYDIPNRDGSLPFHCAVRNGHLDCVKALYRPEILERPVSTGGQTALHDAAAKGHTDIVRFLLAVGHRHSLRDNLGRSPLHVGVLFGNLAVVFLLLECGSDIRCLDMDARTPLSNAFWVWPAQPKVVSLLLGEERELLNFEDEYGRNCAYICAGRGTPELWAEVWPRGYLAKSRDLTEQNLVSVAASFGNLPMLEYLVETDGVAFDDADICGRTPLFWAVKNGFIHVVKKLLELGADVHPCDNQGRTPLHLAIIAGYPRIAQWLLAAGSDHTKRDHLGLSVKDYAKRYWRFAEIFWHLGPRPVAEDDINHVEMLCSFVESTARELAAQQSRNTRDIVKNYTYQAPREALALALFELEEDADAVVLTSELISSSDVAIRCRICKMRSWGKTSMLRCGDCADVYLCQSCYHKRYYWGEETKGEFSITIDYLDVQTQLVAQALWPFVRLDAPGIQFLLRSDSLFTDWVSETYTAYRDLFEKQNMTPDARILPGGWTLVFHLESILNATGGETGGSSKSSRRKLDDLTASFRRFYACSGPFDDPSTFTCRGHKFVRVPLVDQASGGLPDGTARFITGHRTNVAYYTYLAEKYAPGSEEYELLVSGEKETRWSAVPDSDSSAFGNYHENYDYDNSTWLDEGSDRSEVVEDGDDNEVSDDGAERSEDAPNPQHTVSAEPKSERVPSGQDALLSDEETDGPECIVDSLQDLEDASQKSESEPRALGTAPKGASLGSKEHMDGDGGTPGQQQSHEDVEQIDETGGGNARGAEDDDTAPLPQQKNVVVRDKIPRDDASVEGHASLADNETSGHALKVDTPWIPAAVYEKPPIVGPEIIVSLGSDRNRRSAAPKTRSGSTSDSSFIPVGTVTSSSSGSSSTSTSNGSFRSSSTFDAYPIDQFLADMDWWENPFPVGPLPKQKGVITDEAIEFTETKWKLAKAVLASRHRDDQNAVIDWMRSRGFEVIVTERGQEAWRAALEQFQAPPVGGRLNPYRPRSEPIPGWFTNHVRARLGQPPVFLFPPDVVVEGPGSREGSLRSGNLSDEWLPPLSEPNLRAHQSRLRFQQESSDA